MSPYTPPKMVRNFRIPGKEIQNLEADDKRNVEEEKSAVYPVTAKTGAGKTTKIPLLLAKYGRVIVIQGL